MILGRIIPHSFKLLLRERLLNHYKIPWNRHDVPVVLGEYLRRREEITLLDVGASNGDFAEKLRRLCGVKKALLIEPQPLRCEELHKRFHQQDFKVVCAAAANRRGTLEMEVLNWDYSSSILKVRRDRPEVNASLDLGVREVLHCRVDTLDAFCTEKQFLDPVDLLKIDVQGAEHLVLAGAPELLKRTSAVWTEISFQRLYEGSAQIETIISVCRDNGFMLKNISEAFRGANGELLEADALFVKL
jgi:FkbM family methyltransferase